jgi:hypothetical protein
VLVVAILIALLMAGYFFLSRGSEQAITVGQQERPVGKGGCRYLALARPVVGDHYPGKRLIRLRVGQEREPEVLP